jgi:hypothetical protein
VTKLLHTHSKIFFKNPYVVMVEYPAGVPLDNCETEHRKLTRNAYKLLKGTWGYCKLEYEMCKVKNDHNNPLPPGPGHLGGMTPNAVLSVLLDPDYVHLARGYFCFKDELDALQFRLSLDTTAKQVLMWPERWFTIHEVVEDNE